LIFFVNYDIITNLTKVTLSSSIFSLQTKKPKTGYLKEKISVEDPVFGQIRIQGSVSRTKEDLINYIQRIFESYYECLFCSTLLVFDVPLVGTPARIRIQGARALRGRLQLVENKKRRFLILNKIFIKQNIYYL